jgi:WXG100 family type VII secretion target
VDVGTYTVVPSALGDCGATLGAAATAARDSLGRVRSCAAEVHGRWHGHAGSAFRAGCAQWLAGVSAMLDALDELAALLDVSGDGYAATDESVRTSLTAVAR